MLFFTKHKPYIYGGPSLALINEDIINNFKVMPPIKSGDLKNIVKDISQPRVVILVDGVFGSKMSITPGECIYALKKGWVLVGCSSMGALRAADCHNVGMLGVGSIFFGYLFGYYKTDADVAVLYDDENRELSFSAVHIDNVLKLMIGNEKISITTYRKIMYLIRRLDWWKRDISNLQRTMLNAAGKENSEIFFNEILKNKNNPKCTDALYTVDLVQKKFLRK